MKDLFYNQEIPRQHSSSIENSAYFDVRHKPWKVMAARTWPAVKRSLLLTIFVACLMPLPAVAADTRTYDALLADVPFKFHIGQRSFRPGHYQFIFVGNGLLTMRDAHRHVVVSLITRSIDGGAQAEVSKLVFTTQNKDIRLAEIRMQNKSQILEILGEQLAIPTAAPLSPANTVVLFSDKPVGLRLKQ